MDDSKHYRIAAGVEYDGRQYRGWQAQKNALGVQTVVEQALSDIANHPVSIYCAGRTDAEVHALGQVIHFETKAERELHGWMLGANTKLPDSIALNWVRPVAPDFHARFSATGRKYRYVILNRAARPGLLSGRVAWFPQHLDINAMRTGAQSFLGKHDFTSIRAQDCQAKTPVRTIKAIELQSHGEFIILDIEADAFLKHMVRNIVGVLVSIGRRENKPHWVRQVLDAKDRAAAGITAAPGGLYLTEVSYPEHYGIPANPQGPRPPFPISGVTA